MKQLTWAEMKALEGKRVRVWLDFEDHAYVEGTLLNLCEDGEAKVQDSGGVIGCAWPALNMEEL